MKIISIAHTVNENEFVHILANDDVAARQFAQLKAADAGELFKFRMFDADTFADALAYVQDEQDEKGRQL